MDTAALAVGFQEAFARIRQEIHQVIVGQEEAVEQVLYCLFSGGHALLEGVPGIGKTRIVRALAQVLDLKFSRIQFTPDLMPADITGTNILFEDPETGRRRFQFQPGPVFGHLLLADEINRATPKTQSALLEAMQEQQVSLGGERHRLERPFCVLATQNPIELEGTYRLPEAQLDRFQMKVIITAPDAAQTVTILQRTTGLKEPDLGVVLARPQVLELMDIVRQIAAASHVMEYAARLVAATSPRRNGEENKNAPAGVRRFVHYGASPRAAQAILLAGKTRALAQGRYNVSFEDCRRVAPACLRHRLILNFEGEANREVSADSLVREVLAAVPEPTGGEA